jgi:ribosomal protein S6--L-glutamate ligase
MRVAILSAGTGWHVQDLLRAAAQLGLGATAVDFRKLQASIGASAVDLVEADRVLVRMMPPGSLEQVVFRMDGLHRLQARGVPVLNPPLALETCIDKYVTTSKLAAAGIRVPATIVCQHAEAALEAYEILGGDVVVKPLFGSEGRGMVRVTTLELAWRTFQTLERLQAVLYLQRFIPHPGWDLRAFVLGGRVVAAMRRDGNGDWRTNVAQGARAEPVTLAAAEERVALHAARVVEAPVCGVDLLYGQDGCLYVLEVNAVPGWRALAPVTGVDVARLILRYLTQEFGGSS